MKKISIYILAVSIIFKFFLFDTVSVSAEQTNGQFERNFKYIVPMDNKKVDINYEMELILAMREELNPNSIYGEFMSANAVFDFDRVCS